MIRNHIDERQTIPLQIDIYLPNSFYPLLNILEQNRYEQVYQKIKKYLQRQFIKHEQIIVKKTLINNLSQLPHKPKANQVENWNCNRKQAENCPFQIYMNNKLFYSKLKTKMFPHPQKKCEEMKEIIKEKIIKEKNHCQFQCHEEDFTKQYQQQEKQVQRKKNLRELISTAYNNQQNSQYNSIRQPKKSSKKKKRKNIMVVTTSFQRRELNHPNFHFNKLQFLLKGGKPESILSKSLRPCSANHWSNSQEKISCMKQTKRRYDNAFNTINQEIQKLSNESSSFQSRPKKNIKPTEVLNSRVKDLEKGIKFSGYKKEESLDSSFRDNQESKKLFKYNYLKLSENQSKKEVKIFIDKDDKKPRNSSFSSYKNDSNTIFNFQSERTNQIESTIHQEIGNIKQSNDSVPYYMRSINKFNVKCSNNKKAKVQHGKYFEFNNNGVTKIKGDKKWHTLTSDQVLPSAGKYQIFINVIYVKSYNLEVGIIPHDIVISENKICDKSIGFNFSKMKIHDTSGQKQKLITSKREVNCMKLTQNHFKVRIKFDMNRQVIWWIIDQKLVARSTITNYLKYRKCVFYFSLFDAYDVVALNDGNQEVLNQSFIFQKELVHQIGSEGFD